MKIALIGNYVPDGQESMLRYAQLLHSGLAAAGLHVTLAVPRRVLNRRERESPGIWKWIGYLDKYGFGVAEIGRAARAADIVHICDHSNAVYVPPRPTRPYVVTCHDLLAVRGALGEVPDCAPSFTGRLLQSAVVRGLRRTDAVTCVSQATLGDVRRILNGYRGELTVAPNALNFPYRRLPREVVRQRFQTVPGLRDGEPYVLHVGSNARRKNRECVLRTLAELKGHWPGHVVFAGQPLTNELRALATTLGVEGRVREVEKPDSELLEALYNGALALLFPSRFEGFGWPLVEAQAAGCAVVCSDREPFPEVTGGEAIMCDADDHVSFGRAILELAQNPARRDELVARGLTNAGRYGRDALMSRLVTLYRRVLAPA